MNIPSSVKVGVDSVILDCDYDLEGTSKKDLVVKWFLDHYNPYTPVYQWIFGRSPQIDKEAPIAKYIDLQYRASNDAHTMFRAMRLVRPNIDLSGNYTCKISTIEEEAVHEGSMVVYCEYSN